MRIPGPRHYFTSASRRSLLATLPGIVRTDFLQQVLETGLHPRVEVEGLAPDGAVHGGGGSDLPELIEGEGNGGKFPDDLENPVVCPVGEVCICVCIAPFDFGVVGNDPAVYAGEGQLLVAPGCEHEAGFLRGTVRALTVGYRPHSDGLRAGIV